MFFGNQLRHAKYFATTKGLEERYLENDIKKYVSSNSVFGLTPLLVTKGNFNNIKQRTH